MSSEVLAFIVSVVFLVVAVVFLIYQIMVMYLDYLRSDNQKKLMADIEEAMKNGVPNWGQIKEIESTYHLLNDNALKNSISVMIKARVVSGSQENAEQLSLLEGWRENMKADEPFEGIASELKLPLERIRKEAPEHHHVLEMLVAQLQEFSNKSIADKRRASFVSTLSLMVGVAGFLTGAYQVYDARNSDDSPGKVLDLQSSSAGAQ